MFKLKPFILIIFSFFSFPIWALNENLESSSSIEISQKKQSGLMLDISRHFYNLETIKKFIDTLHENNGNFLHLHLSDNENYALESYILGQSINQAYKTEENIYINLLTNKPFLSFEQLRELISYAKERDITIIPELDTPAHMQAIFRLLEQTEKLELLENIKKNDSELNMNNEQSIEFVQSLLSEILEVFASNIQYIHLGADEFSYDYENTETFISYINILNKWLNNKNITTRIWNDGLLKSNINQLDHNIEITYWSYDGDIQDKNISAERKEYRVSLPELLEKNFNVLNYNSYYLYFLPKHESLLHDDYQYAQNDIIQNWDLSIWDGNNTIDKAPITENLLGGAFSIWGEKSENITSDEIYSHTKPILEATIQKINN